MIDATSSWCTMHWTCIERLMYNGLLTSATKDRWEEGEAKRQRGKVRDEVDQRI